MSPDIFDGQTFVAFIDISGFKEMMNNNDRAWTALDTFYNAGYTELSHYDREIGGIFVSDCGVLFWGNDLRDSSIEDKKFALKSLLSSIKNINLEMSSEDFILTTSIAYGSFKFQRRIETERIRKNPIYGNAYLTSYLDNAKGTPKIQPGQCRIVTEGIPPDVLDCEFLKRGSSSSKHYYYYWMVENEDEINGFEELYKDSYNLKYRGMLQALQKYHLRKF